MGGTNVGFRRNYDETFIRTTVSGATDGTIASPRVNATTGILSDTLIRDIYTSSRTMLTARKLNCAAFAVGGVDGVSGNATVALYNVTRSKLMGWYASTTTGLAKNLTVVFTLHPTADNLLVNAGDELTIYDATGSSGTVPVGNLNANFQDTDPGENPQYPNTGAGISGYPPVA